MESSGEPSEGINDAVDSFQNLQVTTSSNTMPTLQNNEGLRDLILWLSYHIRVSEVPKGYVVANDLGLWTLFPDIMSDLTGVNETPDNARDYEWQQRDKDAVFDTTASQTIDYGFRAGTVPQLANAWQSIMCDHFEKHYNVLQDHAAWILIPRLLLTSPKTIKVNLHIPTQIKIRAAVPSELRAIEQIKVQRRGLLRPRSHFIDLSSTQNQSHTFNQLPSMTITQPEARNNTSGPQQEAISDPTLNESPSRENRRPSSIIHGPKSGGNTSAYEAMELNTTRKRANEQNHGTLLECVLRQLSINEARWTEMSKDNVIIKFNNSLAKCHETWQSLMLVSLAIKFPRQFNSLSTSEDEWVYALAEAVSENSFLDIAVRFRLAAVLGINESGAEHQDAPDARTLEDKVLNNEDIIIGSDVIHAVNMARGNDDKVRIIEGLAQKALEEYRNRRDWIIFKKVKRDNT
ncbi:hypothetical protein PFICI_02115 [Pestalotiopsis fici W106-1]|uniref:Uncharacterized protein n=1 Tax=Pestalotiopsis fici (strain W106-1 / CGMCC3.15140) TaxID=1229662 RepID=W3XDG1_PESFW|nr:uncharacterized protein PFICI_02115 [Pestalotiopsis fici W106-1]ETS84090.1 hypothetical protein PFICI_02115 [Pestalotiopsis fici W106-1]